MGKKYLLRIYTYINTCIHAYKYLYIHIYLYTYTYTGLDGNRLAQRRCGTSHHFYLPPIRCVVNCTHDRMFLGRGIQKLYTHFNFTSKGSIFKKLNLKEYMQDTYNMNIFFSIKWSSISLYPPVSFLIVCVQTVRDPRCKTKQIYGT